MRTLLLSAIIFLAACQPTICESPYIRFESGCCLDNNSDMICDKDQISEKQQQKPAIEKKPAREKQPAQQQEEQAFDATITYLKQEIRMLDQAIVVVNIKNNEEYLEAFIVDVPDERWILRSDPYMDPIRVGIRPESKNHVNLILQPNRARISPGVNSFNVTVKAEKSSESMALHAQITVAER
ncbi:hypothetical protein GF323_02850 [Candidatus Woesearchaeota archaeon]|nr:hypothetical protein [Candidatus Woesearchaeota archaeon]